MSLDGLRAWIGQLEWKLGRRTRVFLVLSVIAIGTAGAAIFLAVDAKDSTVSEGDVRELQKELEAQVVSGGGDELTQLKAEVDALKAQVKELEGGGAGSGGSKEGTGGGQSGGSSGNGSGGSDQGASNQGSGGAPSGSPAELQDFLERAKEQQK